MISPIEQLQVLYECSMSIGTGLNLHRMLRKSISTILRKLNCAAGGVHFLQQDAGGGHRFRQVFSIPRDTGRIEEYQAALKQLPAEFDDQQWKAFKNALPVYGHTGPGRYFHVVDLPGLGIIILLKNGRNLDPLFIKSMGPLFAKLSTACQACLQNEEVLQHRDNLEALVQEKSRELVARNQQLIELNRLKNNFIGMAAHDLRTPLAVVEMYAKFLMERAADRLLEKEQGLLRTIVTRSQFMLGLINDLLDVSKIEAGSLELNRHPGNWMSFLRHNAALNGELAARKEVRVAVAPEGGSFTASFDRGKMDQVLDNLMDNAVKFSPRGSTVTVTVTEGEGLVHTTITDEGEGIPEEELPHLFEAFHRGTTSPTAGESGTGLGLAIARRIVEGHNGTIGAESRKGRGSTFFFTLPVA